MAFSSCRLRDQRLVHDLAAVSSGNRRTSLIYVVRRCPVSGSGNASNGSSRISGGVQSGRLTKSIQDRREQIAGTLRPAYRMARLRFMEKAAHLVGECRMHSERRDGPGIRAGRLSAYSRLSIGAGRLTKGVVRGPYGEVRYDLPPFPVLWRRVSINNLPTPQGVRA